jgi:hypothetical protein
MRKSSQPSVGLSVRIDLETHERCRRLQGLFAQSAPKLLKRIFRDYEIGILGCLSDDERDSYFASGQAITAPTGVRPFGEAAGTKSVGSSANAGARCAHTSRSLNRSADFVSKTDRATGSASGRPGEPGPRARTREPSR